MHLDYHVLLTCGLQLNICNVSTECTAQYRNLSFCGIYYSTISKIYLIVASFGTSHEHKSCTQSNHQACIRYALQYQCVAFALLDRT